MGWSQPDYPWLRLADEHFKQGTYSESETDYRKALEAKPKASTQYNLGNSIYQQQRMNEAISQYQKSIESTKDPTLKAQAFYNLGNAHYQNQQYKESIQAYKEALKLNAQDIEAKKNLMLAMRQLQIQQQQQEQQQQNQQEQQQDQQEENQDSSSDNQNQQQQQQQQDSPSSQDQRGSKKDQESPTQMSKEEAKEVLKAIEREDQRVQEKLKRSHGKAAPPVKDW